MRSTPPALRRLLPLLLAALTLAFPAGAETRPKPPRFRAVLVAGDATLEVWDNAVARLAAGLEGGGALAPNGLAVFSARAERQAAGARPATLAAVTAAIRGLKPARGEACLVYLTMHGTPREGLFFEASQQHLTPAALDAALTEGCGEAPTFVVASGCYSGGFATGAMARRNRVVLTAARADRPSFGCGTMFDVTVFDGCFLWGLASAPAEAVTLSARIAECVDTMERRLDAVASLPQSYLGVTVPALVPRFKAAGPAG